MALSQIYGSNGGVVVDIDITFAAQIVLFVLLFLVLKPVLFDPMLRLIEEREKRIDGAKSEAKQMYAEADAKMAKYEEELSAVKREAGAERDRLRAEGAKEEAIILAKVRGETTKLVEEGRTRIGNESAVLRTELDGQAQQLAREIVTRVLGREVSS
jgi:F-type H+-transporting ATPase subunit b